MLFQKTARKAVVKNEKMKQECVNIFAKNITIKNIHFLRKMLKTLHRFLL